MLQNGAYLRMAPTINQAIDLCSALADLANRASDLGVENLDEAFKDLSWLVNVRLAEICPGEWAVDFRVPSIVSKRPE